MGKRLTLREKAERAGIKAGRRHHDASEDEDGWVRCKCGLTFPSIDTWGDHYAAIVLESALHEIPRDLTITK